MNNENFYGFCVPIKATSATEETVKELIESKSTFALQMYSDHCGHCVEASPHIQAASCAFDGVTFLRMDYDTYDPPVEIEGLPTVLIYKDGSLLGKIEGGYEAKDYVAKIRILLDGGTLPPDEE